MPASVARRIDTALRVVAALVLALACATPQAQPRQPAAPEVAALFQRWMASSCIEGEEHALVAAMRRYAPELATMFRRAIAAGPPREDVERARAAAAERYDERAKFPLEAYRIEGVSRDALAAFRRVPQQQFVDDQVGRYVQGYRANAVAGLGIVGGADARPFLARLAASRTDPAAAAAREALKSMSPR
ncbi:MAG: hypothetical protein ABI886_00530 [Betaproteobacteria bacterium]